MNYSLLNLQQPQAGLGNFSLNYARPERMPNVNLYANPADRPQLSMGGNNFAKYAPMIQAALSGMGGGQEGQAPQMPGPVYAGRQYRPQVQGDVRQHFYGLGGY